MDCWALSKRNSWLYLSSMIHILMIWKAQGDCIEEERKALLDIKASHINLYDSKMDHFLPTWVDYGSSTPGDGGGNCCDWQRVNCNTTTGHVTELSLFNLRERDVYRDQFERKLWPLNVSLFLHFKELTSLNLSYNFLDKEIIKTGLERLSSLKKLEELDLSRNDDIDNDILPSLTTLTSLKILNLSYTSLNGNLPISEFAALENLEMLDLSNCQFNGTLEIQASERVSILTKLKTLNLGSSRRFNLFDNQLSWPFPAQALSHLTNLEELDLSYRRLVGTPNIQACSSLSRLKRLESINLSGNDFNKSIISCLTALPSLKILDLSWSITSLRSSFPVKAFASFHHLEVLDLSGNWFVGSVPSAIQALSSLRALSFARNKLNGSLPDHGFSNLKNLHELDLSGNMLHGTLPQCFNNLSSLRFLDISSNQFTGTLVPSLFANLTSLEYVDFSHNTFEGSFSFSSFANHSKLEVIRFSSDNDKFEVETEEPIGWIPLFQLEILELSNCYMNKTKGRVIPGFLLHQHKLRELDMSHNSLEGQFPNWLIKNNMNLEVLILRNNLFGGKPLYRNANMKWLDMSGNSMIGTIPENIPNFFPNISNLNFSMNALTGVIPSSIGKFSKLLALDLSDNKLSGEVPSGLFTKISTLMILKLSRNKLHGEVLSVNLSWGILNSVYLDSNHFTGKFGNKSSKENFDSLTSLDISNNLFTGMIPDWISNMSRLTELVVRNNSFEGRFPCGPTLFTFLDISQNSFSGPIPSCLNLQDMEHLLLGSNRFTGSIPNFFRNLTNVLTLDMGDNDLSGRIPKFIGELSDLRILLLRKNNFSGSIPKQLCQLSDVGLLDLSYNSLSGSIPSCLQNITGTGTGFGFYQCRC
ncbi:receptor-like protein 13 isoform X2 [Lactuca sativa]|uniref:receptor-like protein 13 isoform X2 n=1 Tax=Lactuca sativa TaxID=4236 RepID=UPI001C68BA5E|nr:receptor-like protein 13 isoform X2 [Lactuca sativa]